MYDTAILQKVANTIRVVAAEGVERAGSGHPGLPMGCAEIGAVLFSQVLRHNPKNPGWMGRDRFVLSAGHGSMFLYTCLHLAGYPMSLDDLKSFRQLHSPTAGHPEYGDAPGIETTTGPLGQGVGAATGMAIAQKWLAARFGKDLFGSKVWVLAGDGCMMEGVSSEVSSLAGHLGLDNLVIIYDANDICLDGPTTECFTEDTARRYEAYGFKVVTIDGHDFAQVSKALDDARHETDQPTLIMAKTVIGHGAPNKQGSSGVHGSALGADELKLVKEALDWPEEEFHIPAEVSEFFAGLQETFAGYEAEWNGRVEAMRRSDPAKGELFDTFVQQKLPEDFADQIWDLELKPDTATRRTGQTIITKLAEIAPHFLTGSADLSVSDSSNITTSGIVSRHDWAQRNFKFGVREFGMAAASYGMALHGGITPLCATFFTFSDYMRNALRLCAMMQQKVIFQFTHDSIFLGEDGPTHQPIEHLASLRAMPGMRVMRPCDEHELKACWIEALSHDGPTALVLTRQGIKSQPAAAKRARQGVSRGAYVLHGEPGLPCDYLICATGSEVSIAMEAAHKLEDRGKKVRVVSMPCWELFEDQDADYKASVLDGEVGRRVAIEAASEVGWHKWIGRDGIAICMTTFGESAPAKDLAKHFGFTADQVVERLG